MAHLTDEMKKMLSEQLPILATVTDGDTPNIGPKRTLRAYGDDCLIYNENTGGQHLKNIENGSKIAVAIIDWDALDGYRFIGTGETSTSGEAWDNCVAFAKEKGMNEPKKAVVIRLEAIYSLRSGKQAGTRIDEAK